MADISREVNNSTCEKVNITYIQDNTSDNINKCLKQVKHPCIQMYIKYGHEYITNLLSLIAVLLFTTIN